MKTLTFFLAVLISLHVSAQNLNDKGLYVNEDGELYNGTIIAHSNGIKSEMNVINGVVNGTATYYFASGKVMETGTFIEGKKDQKWTRYSENGNISAVAFYHLGNKTGTWLVYDDKGNKRFEMNYNDGSKSGIWTSWDENGAVVSSKDYNKTF